MNSKEIMVHRFLGGGNFPIFLCSPRLFWGNDPILTFPHFFKGVELIQLGEVSHPSDEKLGSFLSGYPFDIFGW